MVGLYKFELFDDNFELLFALFQLVQLLLRQLQFHSLPDLLLDGTPHNGLVAGVFSLLREALRPAGEGGQSATLLTTEKGGSVVGD